MKLLSIHCKGLIIAPWATQFFFSSWDIQSFLMTNQGKIPSASPVVSAELETPQKYWLPSTAPQL